MELYLKGLIQQSPLSPHSKETNLNLTKWAKKKANGEIDNLATKVTLGLE